MVIGGIAAVLHGVPRATFDLDILIDPSLDNATSLLAALESASFGTATMITAPELVAHEITVFNDRVRIDVDLPPISGQPWFGVSGLKSSSSSRAVEIEEITRPSS